MNLKDRFNKEIAPQLKEKLGCKSIMEVPKLTKITINMGVGEASKDKGVLENAVKDLEAIAGQKVVVTKARKAVASFKIREEYPIGCKVTLRGDRMYDFFERPFKKVIHPITTQCHFASNWILFSNLEGSHSFSCLSHNNLLPSNCL